MRSAGIRAGAVGFAAATLSVACGMGECPDCTAFDWFLQWLLIVAVICAPFVIPIGAVALVVWWVVANAPPWPDPPTRKSVDPKGRDPLD